MLQWSVQNNANSETLSEKSLKYHIFKILKGFLQIWEIVKRSLYKIYYWIILFLKYFFLSKYVKLLDTKILCGTQKPLKKVLSSYCQNNSCACENIVV